MKAIFVVLAVLAASAFAFEETPSLPILKSDGVPNGNSWKSCTAVGKYGTVCGIITVDPSTLTIIGSVTWDGHKVFQYTFSANKVCATEEDILKLVSDVPALVEFKPVIETVIKVMGHIPAKVFSVCLVLSKITWKDQKLSACAKLDITLVCWMGKCAYKGSRDLGCFTI